MASGSRPNKTTTQIIDVQNRENDEYSTSGHLANRIQARSTIQSVLQSVVRADTALFCLPLILFTLAAAYQLGLPGLHYDEAKEAGVNAMELINGAPVSAFRSADITLFGASFPLMVQDYIGAVNVYLALPFLTLTGIGVPNLRFLSILLALLAMICLALAVSEWMHGLQENSPLHHPQRDQPRYHLHSAAIITLLLLAFSPSFIFWSRQGIFVTNLMQPLSYFCIWQGLRWVNRGGTLPALLCAFSAGLAIYAKVQAVWVVGTFGLLLIGWIVWRRNTNLLNLRVVTVGVIAFILPLLPLILFNIQTGGLVDAVVNNASQSYYGVNNANLAENFTVRWSQVRQVLRGEQFWYLGKPFMNPTAPLIAALLILAGLCKNYRKVLPPLLLLVLVFACTLFTISDLFITHFALIHPLMLGVVGIAASTLLTIDWTWRDLLAAATIMLLIVWGVYDLAATVRYHNTLAQSGGLADHSDATYDLAYHLRYNGLGAPITLDWGIDAPVRYLTEGTVTPIEIFGYASPAEPDSGYTERLQLFIQNRENVYLLHAPGQTVFKGRRETFMREAEMLGRTPVLERVFTQRDMVPLFELWRLE